MPSGIAAVEDRKTSRILIKPKQPGRYCFIKISCLRKYVWIFPPGRCQGTEREVVNVFSFLWKKKFDRKLKCILKEKPPSRV